MTDIEHALSNNLIPWSNIGWRTKYFWTFEDDNKIVFVPVNKEFDCLVDSYKGAYNFGFNCMKSDKYTSFIISQVVDFNDTIHYPHITLEFK